MVRSRQTSVNPCPLLVPARRMLSAWRSRRRALTAPHYADDSFDAAFLVAVLGEIPGQDAALREIARVLRPGGRLMVESCSGTPIG